MKLSSAIQLKVAERECQDFLIRQGIHHIREVDYGYPETV